MSRSRELSELATAYDSGSPFGFRNRIINGDCRIDQRNSGSSSALASAVYSLDRYMGFFSSSGTATVQRSSTAPTGFVNSLLVTVGTADSSVAAGDYAEIEQRIEGFNVADLGFGTANAQTITLSFWVRSSVTGTYCVNFRNNGNNRAYVVNYTISAANTWEYKTVTITGDTSGTWTTDNSSGLIIGFCLMVGSTFQQAAGSWGSTSFGFGSSSQTNLMATSGATFYITGVQLEAGSVATPFERRDYGRELIMCQRYYFRNHNNGITYAGFGIGRAYSTTEGTAAVYMPVPMRASPTIGRSAFTGSNWDYSITAINIQAATGSNQLINCFCAGSFTSGGAFNLANGNTTSYIFIDFSAEL